MNDYTFLEYQVSAQRTMSADKPIDMLRLISVLELCSEAGELIDAMSDGDINPITDEIGDVLFCTTFVAHTNGINMEFVALGHDTLYGFQQNHYSVLTKEFGRQDLGETLTSRAAGIAGIIKKAIGHGHPLNVNEFGNRLEMILLALSRICDFYNLSLADVAHANIAKLLVRYPNGFSHEDSMARKDVVGE